MRAVLLAALTLVAAAPATPAGSWLQFRLHNSNNAVLRGTLDVSWRTHTGAALSSSPTIVDGVLYAGDNAGNLFAMDPKNGRIHWTAHVSKPLMSAPLVDGDLVIEGEGDETSPSASTPSHPIHVGSTDNALLGFDRHTGALRWRVPLPGSGMPTGAIIDGVLVHHNGAGSIYGVDPQSGRVLYSRDLHSIASMTAALPIGEGRFVTLGVDTNALWVINAKDGSVVHKVLFSPIASGFGDCPAVGDDRAVFCDYAAPPYASVPSQSDRFSVERAFGIDPLNGKRLWDTYLERGSLPRRNEAAIPLLEYGIMYCGSSVAPYMHALDAGTGSLLWKTQTHGEILGGIVDVDGTIYFGDLGGYLWALNARTGAVIGDVDEGTPFNVGSPVVDGQTLIIGSRGGTVIAVPLEVIRDSRD